MKRKNMECNKENVLKLLDFYEKETLERRKWHKKEWNEGYEQALKNIYFAIATHMD